MKRKITVVRRLIDLGEEEFFECDELMRHYSNATDAEEAAAIEAESARAAAIEAAATADNEADIKAENATNRGPATMDFYIDQPKSTKLHSPINVNGEKRNNKL